MVNSAGRQSKKCRWLYPIAWGLVIPVVAGCVPGPTIPQFAGLYDVTRGVSKIDIGWVIADSNGHVTQGGGSGNILPIDANDANIPALLLPLVEQWNAGLDTFNADIDEVFPNQVVVSHPLPWVVRIANPDDPNVYFEGLNTPKGFVCLVAGLQVGALGASSVTGKWDGHDTVTGEWKVTLALGGGGQQGGAILHLTVTIPYVAIREPED